MSQTRGSRYQRSMMSRGTQQSVGAGGYGFRALLVSGLIWETCNRLKRCSFYATNVGGT